VLQKLTRGLPHARPVRGALELVPAALRHELVRMRVHRDLDAFDSLFRGNKVHRCRGRGLLNNTSPHNQSLRDRQRDTWVSKWSCLAAADGTPRVGQPGWAVWTRPPAPVLPLEGAGRGTRALRRCEDDAAGSLCSGNLSFTVLVKYGPQRVSGQQYEST